MKAINAGRTCFKRQVLSTPKSCSSFRESSSVGYQGEVEQNSPNLANIGFAFAKQGDFVLPEPQHENSYTSDPFLHTWLSHHLPDQVLTSVQPDLVRFGDRCATDLWTLGQLCEQNPPFLRQTNAWGKRIDEIVTCEAWKQQKRVAAEEGLISIPYENEQGEYSRLYQVAKLYMYSPSSGMYSCPLAMTDAAAKTISSQKLELPEAYSHLTSRDPDQFWTSGQWMTEMRGGSDVGRSTETVAVPQEDGSYRLYGYKWFSSATDSDMTLTLARIQDAQGNTVSGSRGISMFYVKIRDPVTGTLNNIQVAKLKNKLGTRQLPTAELLLAGTKATLVSPEGRGIPSISSMLTISRLHNTIFSVSPMRKIISLARDYATKRTAFGAKIADHPLHMQTLARMEVETRGCCALMLELARQLGLHDNNVIGDQDLLLLRLMTPIAKLYTAKAAVKTVSEGIECFGGQGYIEDTGIPGMFRDSQVLPIWEGTTNILSLDLVRAIQKTQGEVLKAFLDKVTQVDKKVESNAALKTLSAELMATVQTTISLISKNPETLEYGARDLAFTLAHTYIATLLLQFAHTTKNAQDADVARLWMKNKEMAPFLRHANTYSDTEISTNRDIVFQSYERK